MTKAAFHKTHRAEQRTRRRHKNSKDGCPNCRAKRVKCGEELPSCLQCVRKKNRCGYLDFPPERLEQLARKNESKLELELERQNALPKIVSAPMNDNFTLGHNQHVYTSELSLNNLTSTSAHSQQSRQYGLLLLPPLLLLLLLLVLPSQPNGQARLQNPYTLYPSETTTNKNIYTTGGAKYFLNVKYSQLDLSLLVSDGHAFNGAASHSRGLAPPTRNYSAVNRTNSSQGFLPLRLTTDSFVSEGTFRIDLQEQNFGGFPKSMNTQNTSPSLSLQPLDSRLQKTPHISHHLSIETPQKSQPLKCTTSHLRQTLEPHQTTPPAHNNPPWADANYSMQVHNSAQEYSAQRLKPPGGTSKPYAYFEQTPYLEEAPARSASTQHLKNHLYSVSDMADVSPKTIPLMLPGYGSTSNNAWSPQVCTNTIGPDTATTPFTNQSFEEQVFKPPHTQYILQALHNLQHLFQESMHVGLHIDINLHSLLLAPMLKLRFRNQAQGATSTHVHSDPTYKLGNEHKDLCGQESRRSLVKVRDRDRPDEDRELLIKPLTKVRSLVYSNMFHVFNQEFGELEDLVPEDFQLWSAHKIFDSSDNLNMKSADQCLLNQGLSLDTFEGQSNYLDFEPRMNLEQMELEDLNPILDKTENIKSVRVDFEDTLQTENTSKRAKVGRYPGASSRINEADIINRKPGSSLQGTPLPNATASNTRFPRLAIPKRLNDPKIERHLEQLKKGGRDNKNLKEIVFEPRPVWSEADAQRHWILLFQQASVYDLYFQYLIDRSVNLLVRASDAVVNGDIISFTLDNPRSQDSNEFFRFFYNKQDLNTLVRKSFVTYGNLISQLRQAITLVGSEYTARMSLFSAYGCYVNPSPDMSSFLLMFTGTLMVIQKILEECQQQNIDTSLRQEILIINHFCLAARFPDYSFNIVNDLDQSFSKYQLFVLEHIALYENGMSVDDDAVKALRDPIFHHNMKELNKFFQKLQGRFYPAIAKCNSYYKALHNYEKDLSIHFVSPTLIFELACEWFRIYPGDKMSMGSCIGPLKKVLYLFFHALAKCLSHVFTPIKSLLLVDACNVTYTKVGMEFSALCEGDAGNISQLRHLAAGLCKTIRFFENRLRLYGFYMEHSSVLNVKFLQGVNSEPPQQWVRRDIIHILPQKISSGERQVQLFSSHILTIDNYAFMEEFSSIGDYVHLIQAELNRQKYAIQNEPLTFIYEMGVYNHDFNPEGVIQCLIAAKTEISKRNGPLSTATMKSWIDNFLASRNEVSLVTSRFEKKRPQV